MKKVVLYLVTLICGVALGACSMQKEEMKKGNAAHAHIGHVDSKWGDTPGQVGLIHAAKIELDIAILHSGFSLKKPDDLTWLKLHTSHVVHALDPASSKLTGPGKGYGLKKAAIGAAKHINFAAGSEGASDNIKLHATHVATSAENMVEWVDRVVTLGKKVENATTAEQALSTVEIINIMLARMQNGNDVNGDGKITWMKGEGGLAQAVKHVGFMKKGEGL